MTADRYSKGEEEMRKKLSVLKPALVNKRGQYYSMIMLNLTLQKRRCRSLKNCNMKLSPHPLYSSDLSPTDYHLFKKLELHLWQKNITKSDDLKNDVLEFLDSRDRSFFSNVINKLVSRWQ
uniref:Mariner Mos1 transposase n=1 Tax=Strongyloides papillosus TaxID=174720 RepID=A0A0N5CBG0_STREA